MAQGIPRGITILVSAILVLVGVIGTFFGLIPNVGSVEGETIGIVAYVAATLLMLGGIFISGL
jgi:uncharacterized membrane protein YhhN